MDGMELDIYNFLNKIDKLDANNYSDLLKNYNENVVNNVIENMIEMDVKFISKFYYYISKVAYYDNIVTKTLYDAYSLDLNLIPVLTKEENFKLAKEINEIINEIKVVLKSVNYVYNDSSWISDIIEHYLEICSDLEVKKMLQKLYNTFVYKRNKLTEGNLKFVIFVGKKYIKNGIDIIDIIQYGNIGLMKACEKYEPSFNSCFSTYAYYWIKQNITKNISQVICPVSIPYALVSFNVLIKKCIKELKEEYGEEPNIYQIAEYTGFSVEKVIEIMQVFSDPVSLNDPINFSGDNDEYTLMDSLEDQKSNVFTKVLNKNLSKEVLDLLVNNLTDMEFNVLCHRYELNNCSFMTLREIGISLGVSRERVRQIEVKAINKIKRKAKHLVAYLG